ncbi:hypothetical protein BS78_K089200 [Paspalum vaginatum]|uniref:Uncharacterized protein n=1 Tax=Paspalum vaginatum TaxID=158149 RepID=A0A9W8CFC8_9POAL|nr:hypothetical protein BS78_K089200 [Paspalum vaginatum]
MTMWRRGGEAGRREGDGGGSKQRRKKMGAACGWDWLVAAKRRRGTECSMDISYYINYKNHSKSYFTKRFKKKNFIFSNYRSQKLEEPALVLPNGPVFSLWPCTRTLFLAALD